MKLYYFVLNDTNVVFDNEIFVDDDAAQKWASTLYDGILDQYQDGLGPDGELMCASDTVRRRMNGVDGNFPRTVAFYLDM